MKELALFRATNVVAFHRSQFPQRMGKCAFATVTRLFVRHVRAEFDPFQTGLLWNRNVVIRNVFFFGEPVVFGAVLIITKLTLETRRGIVFLQIVRKRTLAVFARALLDRAEAGTG